MRCQRVSGSTKASSQTQPIDGIEHPRNPGGAQIEQAMNRAEPIHKHPPAHFSHGRILRPGFPAQYSSTCPVQAESGYASHESSCVELLVTFCSQNCQKNLLQREPLPRSTPGSALATPALNSSSDPTATSRPFEMIAT